MKKLLSFVFLFTACASTQPVVTPPVVTPPVPTLDTVYLPGKTVDSIVYKYDTTIHNVPDPIILSLPDTTLGYAILSPSPLGEDWPQLQAAINYNIRHHIYPIYFTGGNFQFNITPPIVADTTGGSYHQVSIGLYGVCPAMNTPMPWTTNFYNFTPKTFGLGIQLGKGCSIENIAFVGQYALSSTFNKVQIDTLPFASWADTICSVNNTSPYAGIAIDPFSNPANYDGVINKMYSGLESYYLPGMNQSGSTAITIRNCSFSKFIVAIVIAPGFQENGEEISIKHSSIGNCRSGICPTNAQQKSNRIEELQVWAPVHTVIDCSRYGAHRGDGSIFPIVDGVNLAYYTHQFMNYYSGSHPGSARNVYSEGMYKIGFTGGPAGFNFDNCQFNLQLSEAGTPFPDYVVAGGTMTFTNTEVRNYGDSIPIVLNTPLMVFKNGTITYPPVFINQELAAYPRAKFEDVSMYLSGLLLNTNDYDSLIPMGTVQMTVNPDFTGYFLSNYSPKIGDLLITQHAYGDDYPQYGGPIGSREYPLGVVASLSTDTVFLRHIGQGLHTGDNLFAYDRRIKSTSGLMLSVKLVKHRWLYRLFHKKLKL